MTTLRNYDGRAGFALVETLVASALIATMLAVTYQVVQSNAAMVGAMADRRAAVLVAQSVLAAAHVPLSAGREPVVGTDGAWTWRLVVSGYGNPPPGPMALQRITVTVSDRRFGRRAVRLSTLRLAP